SEYLMVGATAPGVFTFNSSGRGQAAVLNQDYSANGSPGSSPGAKPEGKGRFIVIYANGQGRQLIDGATNQLLSLPSGFPAPSGGPLYLTATNPTVTIGGVRAQAAFSGLAPGFVGLWQLNVKIPDNAPTGNEVPLVISLGEITSRTTTIAIN